MSAHLPPGLEDHDTTDRTDSPGRRLRVARQARGLELDRIATELHLRPAMIESLEQDDYDALPGEVFVVGYIRKYARVVELDPEPLLAAYRQAVPVTTRAWLLRRTSPRSARQVGSGHLVVRLVSIGVLILLAALAFIWWQGRESGEEHDTGIVDTEQQSVPAEVPDADADAAGQTPTDADADTAADAPQPEAAGTRVQELAEPAGRPQPVSSDEQQPTPTAAEDAPAPEPTTSAIPADAEDTAASTDDATPAADVDAEAGEIVMTFDGPCWVDVRDSERKYKLFGEMKKGDRHVLEGTPPYSVILGNAAAVTITIDGAAFDLNTISRGNVARFSLDPSASP
jgi:cytoskeleton protein RodZ